MSDNAELIAEARGKYKSLDGVVVVSPRLLARLAAALEVATQRPDIETCDHEFYDQCGFCGVDAVEWFNREGA